MDINPRIKNPNNPLLKNLEIQKTIIKFIGSTKDIGIMVLKTKELNKNCGI
jgi:hypothetical protein